RVGGDFDGLRGMAEFERGIDGTRLCLQDVNAVDAAGFKTVVRDLDAVHAHGKIENLIKTAGLRGSGARQPDVRRSNGYRCAGNDGAGLIENCAVDRTKG